MTPASLARYTVNEYGCWIWQGYCNRDGYGQVKVQRQNRRAHRVVYEHYVGPIPEGMQLDHLCRVRNCVNPAHLEPVTQHQNLSRGTGPNAIPMLTNHCQRGHEFTPENTRVQRGGKARTCRTCHDAAIRAWKERQTLSANCR